MTNALNMGAPAAITPAKPGSRILGLHKACGPMYSIPQVSEVCAMTAVVAQSGVELQMPLQHLVMENVSWGLYGQLLRATERQHLSLTYDRGRLEIMSPLPEHERRKKILARCLETLAFERNIPIVCLGSTTFRQKSAKVGLEPDECYYIQHEPQMWSKNEIDLAKDPPPDLAIEVDITRRAIERPSVYARLGVPEIWRFDGQKLRGYLLQNDGAYREIDHSAALPFLAIADLERFLLMIPATREDTVLRSFRDWVRQNLPGG